MQPGSCQSFELNNFTNLHIGVSEPLMFALNKFSLKARYAPQIKMTVPYDVFFNSSNLLIGIFRYIIVQSMRENAHLTSSIKARQ